MHAMLSFFIKWIQMVRSGNEREGGSGSSGPAGCGADGCGGDPAAMSAQGLPAHILALFTPRPPLECAAERAESGRQAERSC